MRFGIESYRVTGYTYEADYHCTEHATERFGKNDLGHVPEDATDGEGNPVGAIFADSDVDPIQYCGEGDHVFCANCGNTGPAFRRTGHVSKDGRRTGSFGWGRSGAHNVCPNCGATDADRED